MKQFVALARVSSREQEREGFSLAVQEDALQRYAKHADGQILKLFRIAETASKSDERKTFKELVAFTKRHADELDGLLFYKVDRAARNLYDYVELERLESEYGVPFISISQPTDGNPAGRMMRRTLANMASFYTEQLSVDVREGHARRIQEGWLIGRAPYGYKHVRKDGRGVVVVDEPAATNVRRLFHLFAYEPLTLDALVDRMRNEGRVFTSASPSFPRSTVHRILRDRVYIGEIQFQERVYAAKHEAIVERATWERVQTLLGAAVYRAHEMTYAGEFMQCAHCGRPVTGERKTKKTKSSDREYVYYRCSRYNSVGHPRVRVTESELDRQIVGLFAKMRIEDDEVREWSREVLRSQTRDVQAEVLAQRSELQRQQTLLAQQQDRLLNLRIDDQVDQETFAAKSAQLRERVASVKLQLETLDRSHDENADLAVKVFELSQTLQEKWITADYAAKRRILDIVCLNCRLDGVNLVPTVRKPFDVLAAGLVSRENWGSRI